MKKALIVLCGLPACGKSTFRNNLLAERARVAQNAVPAWTAWSSDDVIERIAKQYGRTYTETFEGSIKKAEVEYFNQIRQAVSFGDQVILADRTHMSVQARRRILDVVKNIDPSYEFWALTFECRTVEWDKRLKNRPDKVIPEIVLKRMMNAYVPPSEKEGFKRIENINTSEPVNIKAWHEKIEWLLE